MKIFANLKSLITIIILTVILVLISGYPSTKVQSQTVVIRHVAWQPNGHKIVIGSGPDVWLYNDNSTELWHLHEGNFLESVTWSPDGSHFALLFSANERDWFLQIYDSNTQTLLKTFGEQDIPLYYPTVRWNPNGRELAIAVDHEVQIRDATSGQRLSTMGNFTHEITDIAWSPDGNKLAILSVFNIHIWDVINWSETVSARIPEGIKSVVWEPDSIRLATVGSEPTTITIWNSDTLEIETRLQGHRGTISDLAWGTAGLASVSNDRTIRIWDVTTGATRQIIPTIDQPLSLDWSPDGNQLAYVDNGNLVINSISSR